MDLSIEKIKKEIKLLAHKQAPTERKCKTCNIIKDIKLFDKSYNKNCTIKKRSSYMKDYYKKHYVKKGRAKKYKKREKVIPHCQGCTCNKN
jgi:hypothetical protein